MTMEEMGRADTRTLEAMLGIYCRDKHGSSGRLCTGCLELRDYAVARLLKCPFGDKKPTCGQCTVHCYKPVMRERAREVMKYSGPRMMTAHPVLAARHILQGIMNKPRKKEDASSR
ncbi:MAG: nitrous oxide-stimulated promoter family protein [bacterium]